MGGGGGDNWSFSDFSFVSELFFLISPEKTVKLVNR